jgi:P-type E1-E2 ATPase
MVGMVALSVVLRFWQEARADTAAQKLKAMIHVTATVVRDGAAREIPLRDLVPGDIIKLAAGDMIPGDVRLLSSKDLFVSQGSLTGESLPIEKSTTPKLKRKAHPLSSRTHASWGRALRAARRRQLWSRRGCKPTWGVWPARSPGNERRRALTRASTASHGS